MRYASRSFRWLFLAAWLLLPALGYGQKVFDLAISGDYRQSTLIAMFIDLEARYPVKFYYDPDVLPYYQVNYQYTGQTLFNALQTTLPANGLVSIGARENGIMILRKTDMNRAYINDLLQKWDEKKIVLPDFLTAYELDLQAGELPVALSPSVEVKGIVRDEQTRDPIAGASVQVAGETKGASTNALGRFSLALAPGVHRLLVGYVGYRETVVRLQVNQSGEIEIPLQVSALELATVEIQGNKSANKQTAVATGVEMLSAQKIKELPTFMGESDVLKSLLALPGVSTVGEGASGFNVRGGNIDQNLVIQDDLPFFNTSHVLGFFSVFNTDLVRSTTLYKGHIPARLGGKIASALEVKLKEGNFREWHGSAGAGLAAAKLTLEGPLWKDKVSIIVGARTSYSDWMLKRAKLPLVNTSSAWFNDFNGKLAVRLGKNGALNVGLHRSQDYFRFAREFGYEWQTTGGSVVWRQSWNGGVVTSLTAASGRLENNFFQPAGTDAFELHNGLAYSMVNLHASLLSLEGHEIMAGAQWNRNNTLPQTLAPLGADSGIAPDNVQLENGEEWAGFVSDEIKISDRLMLDAGLRYSYFRSLGPHRVFTYEPNTPFSPETIIDTINIGANQSAQTYGGLEPRISLNFKLNATQNIKLSYNRLRQYLHLISNTTSATPADIWQPSNRYLQPQISDSYSGGWFFTPDSRRWETSVELFYRSTAHVPAYEDFATLLLNDHLETELIDGKQTSYGSEFLYRKNEGRWTGWLGYTFSRVWQQARSPYPALSVNRGEWFPANFDQPHQVILFAKYAINPALYWTFNFTYRTGRPVTAPLSGYQVGTVIVPNYAARNNLRIPDYHRLDIGLTLDKTKSKLDGLRWTLNLSLYNVYGRKNAFSVFFKRDKKGLPKAYQLAVVGSIIPAANLVFYW